MKLRTKSRGLQALVWLGVACVCVCLYALTVRFFGTGLAAVWHEPDQMRFLLPFLALFGWLAYETRWDGIVRKVRRDAPVAHEEEVTEETAPVCPDEKAEPVPVANKRQEPAPPASPPDPSPTSEAWQRAREMPHKWIPDPEKDAEYLRLVLRAADEGCVPAILKLAEYASRRGVLVETYFWMALAEKRGHVAARQQMLTIRKKWQVKNCPPEYGNVYRGFPEVRGAVGRALLAKACGLNIPWARKRLRHLAASGQVDACLLLGMPIPLDRT